MSCLVCTQQPWGVLAYDALKFEFLPDGPTEPWLLIPDLGHVMSTKYLLEMMAPKAEDGTLLERPRYAFFLNWSGRLPKPVLESTTCVNFHCTPLPYGRGGHPIENMILAGHTETVMTAHRMVEEIDAGPIYATRGPISLAGTKEDILGRFVEPVAQLMVQISLQNPAPIPQAGEIVRFNRLPPSECNDFWKLRGIAAEYE